MKNLLRMNSIAIIAVLIIVAMGCDEGLNMVDDVITGEPPMIEGPGDTSPEPTVPDEEPNPAVVMGEVKDPNPNPEPPVTADPEADPGSATEEPTVSEVGFYRDWQLMEEVAAVDVMRPGDTIYIKVVFSEPMQHIADAGARARPALSLVLDGQETRFQVAEHGVSGEQFTSGVCKPLHGGVDDYICKVTIPADTVGTVALRVEIDTTDTAGNSVAQATVHPSPFVVEVERVIEPEPVPADPVEPEATDPTATIVIETVALRDKTDRLDESIYISGTSTGVPEGALATIVVEGVIATSLVSRYGNWAVFISRAEVPAETVSVSVTVADVSVSGVFTLEDPSSVFEGEYTFTLEGITYPGYNPPPRLLEILETHPSAQLPYFEEAVKITEVVDWVYLMVWEMYPDWETNQDSVNRMIAARRAVKKQFGVDKHMVWMLDTMFYQSINYEPESYYWLTVEVMRLMLEHPHLRWVYSGNSYPGADTLLREAFQESLDKGHIIVGPNPHNE